MTVEEHASEVQSHGSEVRGHAPEMQGHAPEMQGRGSEMQGHAPEMRGRGSLTGRKFLVTAGPTVEAIDPVRFISNHSSGKMGYALAADLAARGAEVTLASGPVALPTPAKVARRIDVVSAEDMYRACVELWPSMDGAVMCAAVADYTPANPCSSKIKKGPQALSIALEPTRDIAATLGATKRPGQILVGFALETDNEESNAAAKLRRKNLDMIVLNSLRNPGAGFATDTNQITILTPGSSTPFPLKSKTETARDIVDSLERLL